MFFIFSESLPNVAKCCKILKFLIYPMQLRYIFSLDVFISCLRAFILKILYLPNAALF